MVSLSWEAVAAIAQVVSALGIVFLGIQVVLYHRELADDHDRSRRENAIKILLEWAQGLGQNTSLTRKFVEELDEDQIKSLKDLEPFEVSKDLRELAIACVDNAEVFQSTQENRKPLTLPRDVVKVIKWQTVAYLNLLESVLLSWRHNIADRKMIEEQFESLIDSDNRHTMLEKYRNACGGHAALPAIEEFYQSVLHKQRQKQEIHTKVPPGRPPIGPRQRAEQRP